ncbi:MAG TPA: DUF2269 family protein [Actinomycetota bacterium]|nr:DUF2269 family protein [Actinomycetota bacterium]
MYIRVLLFLHVLSAIAGFGPTFVFAITGGLMRQVGPNGGPVLLDVNKGIERKLLKPASYVVQPLTGFLLIGALGIHRNWGDNMWLVISLVLYAIALTISLTITSPALKKMIRITKGEEGAPADLPALGKKSAMFGGIQHLLLISIIFLMVVKPGRG